MKFVYFVKKFGYFIDPKGHGKPFKCVSRGVTLRKSTLIMV